MCTCNSDYDIGENPDLDELLYCVFRCNTFLCPFCLQEWQITDEWDVVKGHDPKCRSLASGSQKQLREKILEISGYELHSHDELHSIISKDCQRGFFLSSNRKEDIEHILYFPSLFIINVPDTSSKYEHRYKIQAKYSILQFPLGWIYSDYDKEQSYHFTNTITFHHTIKSAKWHMWPIISDTASQIPKELFEIIQVVRGNIPQISNKSNRWLSLIIKTMEHCFNFGNRK